VKVVAALSGGVDSAVAAAHAVDAGHEVVAVHLALTPDPREFRDGARGCCSLEDARDARRVADVLGIPFYVWDLADRFKEDVIDDFVAEYAAGRTPNPCLRCNERIKFAAVLDRALDLGFDAVVTGHYATLHDNGQYVELHRSVDDAKDQSYVLSVLRQEQLAHSLFPLGPLRKDEVRRIAVERRLLVADKPDSHDICFIADGRTSEFLRERIGAEPGAIVDAETGDELGAHEGVHAFTVGQRKGLHIGQPRPDGAPRYVVGVDPSTRTVLVGPEQLLRVDFIVGESPIWCGPAPEQGDAVGAQMRAHGRELPATVRYEDDRVEVSLLEPERGVASGQTVALYERTRVVGSATIMSTARQPQPH